MAAPKKKTSPKKIILDSERVDTNVNPTEEFIQEPKIVAPKTIQQVMSESNRKMYEAKERRKKLTKQYRDEPKVDIYLSPLYAPYFGKVMLVSINGVSIFVKVNGAIHSVPKTFADEITSRRMKIDAIITKQTRGARVSENYENSAGEAKLY